MSQCPVSFRSTAVTVVATSFICGARIAALAFSPAIDRTIQSEPFFPQVTDSYAWPHVQAFGLISSAAHRQ